MRAKNEFKFIAEAYNTKLLYERIVDGTLMCPEACCGKPVMECKCGPDCPHCNCHEIQKLAKDEDEEMLAEIAPALAVGAKIAGKGALAAGKGALAAGKGVAKAVKKAAPVVQKGALAAGKGVAGAVKKAAPVVQKGAAIAGKGVAGAGKSAVAAAKKAGTFDTRKAEVIAAADKLTNQQSTEDNEEYDDDSDAALWKKQMKHQSEVSPEEVERIKKQKPAPQGRLTMPGDKDRDDTRTLKEMQRDIMNGMTAKESMEGMGIHPANQKSLLAKYMKFSKGSEGPIETGFEGPIISQLDVDAAARERLRQKYGEDNEEPRRGISGYEHKPDALVSARQAGAKHKPYVSSFVSDGGKIFGVMGSDGKIVHKTRDKQKAYKWFRDNYDNI